MSDTFTNPEYVPTPVRRTKDGRPYVYDLDKGKEAAWTRVTSFIDVLEDKTMLAKWGERMALLGVRDDAMVGRALMALQPAPQLSDYPTHDELVERNGRLDEEKKALNAIITEAKESAGWKDAANLGTRLHELTELVDGGEHLPRDTPMVLADDVRAYEAALKTHGLEPLEREVFVVNDEVKAAGTFDRVFRWTRPDGIQLNVIGDLKTGRVDYGQGKLAMQLALYANSSRYDPETPEERGELDVSREVGLIIHLPVGRAECRVYVTDLTLGWQGVLLASQVREWRRVSARGVLSDLALDGDLLGQLSASVDALQKK